MAHKSWLLDVFARPHFQEWWEDPEYEWQLLENEMPLGAVFPFIAMREDEAMAYIQYWRVDMARGWVDDEEEIWLQALSDDTIGVDISLARQADLGRGYGREILRQFVTALWAEGHRNIIIDPDIRNTRAIRAYRGAGFVRIGQYPSQEGGTLLMKYAPRPVEDQRI